MGGMMHGNHGNQVDSLMGMGGGDRMMENHGGQRGGERGGMHEEFYDAKRPRHY